MNESQRLGIKVANGLMVLGTVAAFFSNDTQVSQIGFAAMTGGVAATSLIYAGDVVASKFQQWRAKVETQELKTEVTKTIASGGSLTDDILTKISNNVYRLGTAFEENCTDKGALKATQAWLDLAKLATTDILLSEKPMSAAGDQLLKNETHAIEHAKFLVLDLNYSKDDYDSKSEPSLS